MSTPESLAENKFKAERLADLERFAELDAHTMLRLSDDELAEFVAPDPYAKGIRALLEAKR